MFSDTRKLYNINIELNTGNVKQRVSFPTNNFADRRLIHFLHIIVCNIYIYIPSQLCGMRYLYSRLELEFCEERPDTFDFDLACTISSTMSVYV